MWSYKSSGSKKFFVEHGVQTLIRLYFLRPFGEIMKHVYPFRMEMSRRRLSQTRPRRKSLLLSLGVHSVSGHPRN
jgi:hypothetical protein